jgi:membrane-bound inhibitor of C-type lysozyme
MPSRRLVLTGAAAAALCVRPVLAALPVPSSDTLAFRIMRNGARIGTHSLSFQKSGEALNVHVEVEIAVYFGPIRLFHYNHKNLERWRGGQLESMDAATDYDGTPAFATLRREREQIVAEGSKAARYTNALAATHWNKTELSVPMINPENGTLLRPVIANLGIDNVALASGANVAAQHYTWRGADMLDLWYGPDGSWTALTAVTKDGTRLVYERL